MALVINERFTVRAPVERVWTYLTDPREVVGCVPGAELTSVEPDGSFRGRVTVKVGPVMVGYLGQARFEELDAQARRVRMVATGREGSGSGSATMRMTSSITPLADGSSEVHVDASVELTGKIVQFGRGLIDDVSRQLIRQFVTCVRTTLEPGAEAAPAASSESAAAAAAPARRSRPSVEAMPLVRGALWRWLLRLFRWRKGGQREQVG